MTEQRFTTQGNMSYLPWVVPVDDEDTSAASARHESLSSPREQAEILMKAEISNNAEILSKAETLEKTEILEKTETFDKAELLNNIVTLNTAAADSDAKSYNAAEAWNNTESKNDTELFNEVKDWALRALGRKDYSRRDLKRYLLDRIQREETSVNSSAALCEEVLDLLEAEHWLDEQRAIEAQLLKSQYRELGFRGKKQRLQQQGYTEEAILMALADDSSDDEFDRLLELATKRAGQLRDLDLETARRRLSGFLLRRGYSGSEVGRAISQVLNS